MVLLVDIDLSSILESHTVGIADRMRRAMRTTRTPYGTGSDPLLQEAISYASGREALGKVKDPMVT